MTLLRSVLSGILFLGASGAAFAETAACEVHLSRMVEAMELAASASSAGDPCATADAIEGALNAAGDAQSECTAEGYALASQYIGILPSQLANAVQLCGR